MPSLESNCSPSNVQNPVTSDQENGYGMVRNNNRCTIYHAFDTKDNTARDNNRHKTYQVHQSLFYLYGVDNDYGYNYC